jgi:uncharacterized damage-inducible protein DinB
MQLQHAVEILERTPRVLATWLDGLDMAWTHSRYGPDTFSPYHVVGHLIIGEREDWIARAKRILTEGTARAFDPFPHVATIEPESGRSLEDLLGEFARLRHANLDELDRMQLTPEKLALRGVHPAFGEVTLSQLIATWATHDIHHIGQVAKAMAWQYKEAVGPWRAYLNILPR